MSNSELSKAERLNADDIFANIKKWVAENFDEAEVQDPSWNIEALAEHLARNLYLYMMIERIEADMCLSNMVDDETIKGYTAQDITDVVLKLDKCCGLYGFLTDTVDDIARSTMDVRPRY